MGCLDLFILLFLISLDYAYVERFLLNWTVCWITIISNLSDSAIKSGERLANMIYALSG